MVEVVGGGSECAVYSRVSGWLTYVVGVFRLCLFSPPVFAVFCVCFDTKGSRAAFGTATPPKVVVSSPVVTTQPLPFGVVGESHSLVD